MSNNKIYDHSVNFTYDEVENILRADGMKLNHVIKQDYNLCRIAVRQNGEALQFVQNQTISLCADAYEQTPLAKIHMKQEFVVVCKYFNKTSEELFELGRKLKRKGLHEDAFVCHSLCAKRGNINSINALGNYYLRKKDYKIGVTYLKMAVDKGYTTAMINLGVYHEVTEKDNKKAKYYYDMVNDGSTKDFMIEKLRELYIENQAS